MKNRQLFLKKAQMKQYLLNGCVLVALLALTGCVTPIGVEKVSARQAYKHLHQNALNSSRCSAETMKVLHRYNLDDEFDKIPTRRWKNFKPSPVPMIAAICFMRCQN